MKILSRPVEILSHLWKSMSILLGTPFFLGRTVEILSRSMKILNAFVEIYELLRLTCGNSLDYHVEIKGQSKVNLWVGI